MSLVISQSIIRCLDVCEQCTRTPNPGSGLLSKHAAQRTEGDRECDPASVNLPYSSLPERSYISFSVFFLLLLFIYRDRVLLYSLLA